MMENTAQTYTSHVTSRVVKTRDGYGLFIIRQDGKSKTYPDISRDLKALCAFSDKINDGHVSPLHIDDIIEDMLE